MVARLGATGIAELIGDRDLRIRVVGDCLTEERARIVCAANA